MVVVKGTRADDNILAFAEIFRWHGVPNRLHSDNGAPFNGKDSRLLQQYLRSRGVVHITKATGLVEAFMKHFKKIFQTAGVEREDPFMKLNDYLMQFRATLHATVKKCPAELLFSRRFNTKLPDLRTNPAKKRKDIVEAKKVDKLAKERMKKYKDASRHVKDHDIEVGDLVIAKRRTAKDDSIYNPKPYKVVTVHATQVKGMREDGKHKTRDSQKWKRVQVQARRRYTDLKSTESTSKYLDDTDIGAGYQDDWDNRYKTWGAGLDGVFEGGGAGLDIVFEGGGAGLDDVFKAGGAGLDDVFEAGGVGLDGVFEDEGAGLDDTFEDKGAGLDGVVKGVDAGRQEQGQVSDGTNTEGEGAGHRGGNSYLQADPRLVEAHDDSTVVHPTGAARSAPGTLQGPKLLHSQSLTGKGQGGRKRAASDTGSSTSSSRSGNRIKANHESTSAKVVLAKRRQQSRQ